MSPSLAAITIDVDSLHLYGAIHGLPPIEPAEDPIYSLAIPRFFALLAEFDLPATLFLIGQDAPQRPEVFAPLDDLGCEVASHSYGHDYRLTKRDRQTIRDDLQKAHEALLPLSPSGKIVGFRAPGYNTSPELLEEVALRGYEYDSSLLPAPLYYLARGAAIGRYALSKRPSSSLLGSLRAFSGPRSPHRIRPERPWKPVSSGPLWEYPMACAPKSRIPLIGTSWVLFAEALRMPLLKSALADSAPFNFEMHAIDLLDAQDPGVPEALVAVQPDLKVPLRKKEAAFRQLFARLKQERQVLPLAQWRSHLARSF